MAIQAFPIFRSGWVLFRATAVVSSSVATIISTMLPLSSQLPFEEWIFFTLLFIVGAFVIHGALTHTLNDYVDHQSGTDEHSPAILSGGSRVIQTGLMSFKTLQKIAIGLFSSLFIAVIGLVIVGFYELSVLLMIGIWGAASYSLPPLQFSYRPFAGEWLSLFPAMFFLGIGGVWLVLGHIPEWALQNATMNALFCMAWVMVHHIPDREADEQAVPQKRTSVVWSAEKFGAKFSFLPSLFYFSLVVLCTLWLGSDRLWAALGVIVIGGAAIYLVTKMNVEDHAHVSNTEKSLLFLAVINAIWLGIFI